jgi:hypothetical protein
MIHFHAQAEEMMQVAYTALAKALVSLPEEKLPVGSFRDNSAWDLLEIYKLHRSVYSDTVQVKRIGQYLENLAKLNLLRKWQGFALFLLVCPVEIRARLLDDSSTVLGMSYETREAWMRYALVDDTLWPTVFAKPWTRANQRKSWAHSLRIWDFSATSPTMLVNTNDEIRGVTMGRPEEGVVAEQLPQERPMARTLDLLSQCLVGREWYQSRGVQDLDALITLVSQKRHWDATHETLYVTSQTSFRFFNGFINMAPASHEEHHPPQQPGLGTLMSFFTADSVDSDEGWDRTLLIMPIHAPGHFTLAAFWWINSNEGTREMGCAYFDSIASNDVDTEFTTPLLEPLKQLYNFNVAAGHPLHYKQFDGVELHQRLSSATYDTGGGQCPAIVLYEMDFLCTHTVKNITPQARVQQLFDSVKQAHTRATRPEEKYSVLSDAAERWTRRSILPDPKSGRLGWEPQVQMLQSLHTITRVMAERDENFPLLTDWTAGLRTVVTLALREERSGNVDNRFMYAAMMDALSLNRVLQHWRHHIVHAYMQADKDHRLAALHTFRLGLQDDPVVHDHMFSGVWTPTPEVGAALTTLFALVPSRMDQQLQMYLEVWYLHVLFFPVRPRGAAALRFARAYWAEMSLNTDMLEAVLWRRDSVGGEKRARFAFLLKAIRDKGTHRHRALAVLRYFSFSTQTKPNNPGYGEGLMLRHITRVWGVCVCVLC